MRRCVPSLAYIIATRGKHEDQCKLCPSCRRCRQHELEELQACCVNAQVYGDSGSGAASTTEAPPEDATGTSESQGAQEGSSQRPPSGEKRYQLTVAQRAKEAAVTGAHQFPDVRGKNRVEVCVLSVLWELRGLEVRVFLQAPRRRGLCGRLAGWMLCGKRVRRQGSTGRSLQQLRKLRILVRLCRLLLVTHSQSLFVLPCKISGY